MPTLQGPKTTFLPSFQSFAPQAIAEVRANAWGRSARTPFHLIITLKGQPPNPPIPGSGPLRHLNRFPPDKALIDQHIFKSTAEVGLEAATGWIAKVIEGAPAGLPGSVSMLDAANGTRPVPSSTITDPPYYDNIGYADLSDFFYVWLRRTLKDVFPQKFATVLVPKERELVATPYRFAGRQQEAEQFFLNGMRRAISNVHRASVDGLPTTSTTPSSRRKSRRRASFRPAGQRFWTP